MKSCLSLKRNQQGDRRLKKKTLSSSKKNIINSTSTTNKAAVYDPGYMAPQSYCYNAHSRQSSRLPRSLNSLHLAFSQGTCLPNKNKGSLLDVLEHTVGIVSDIDSKEEIFKFDDQPLPLHEMANAASNIPGLERFFGSQGAPQSLFAQDPSPFFGATNIFSSVDLEPIPIRAERCLR